MFRLLPAALSCLILAAHFVRYSNHEGVVVCLCMPILAASWRRRWMLRALQVLLVIGAILWLHTGYGFVQERIATDRPYQRLMLILGGVSAFSLYSAWLLSRPALWERFEG